MKKWAPQSIKGWVVFFLSMAVASVVCALLQRVSTSDVHVPLIFVLATVVTSLFSEGYFYGFLSAVTSVIMVNYAFTYPYAQFDFTAYGYPLTFMTMLVVGGVISTLTSRVREQERYRVESEREKIRANLLRAISHDLRTPLTAISGSVTAVLDNNLSEKEQRQLLTDARDDAEWLRKMVENLLSVTKISDGKMQALYRQDELPEEIISGAVINFKKRNPGIDVKVEVPSKPVFVKADAMLIEQVLMNLMDNAAVHGQTTKNIEICVTDAGKEVLIRVMDDGKGIDPEKLDHLFDGKTGQSDGDNDRGRGMGIGLMVCRSIIEAHDGTIWAENRPGHGAAFVFSLPAGEEDYA